MSQTNMKKSISMSWLHPVVMAAIALVPTVTAHAATPGIKDANFTLTAKSAYISQPDGQMIYSWGYGCTTPGSSHTFAPSMSGATCSDMQIPGPTLIVKEGVAFDVTLTNGLPAAAGNTSILFPGLQQTAPPTGGTAGLLTSEAAVGGSVTYHLLAKSPGTRAYYSGTRGDLQVEMGLYGAVVVLPASVPANCNTGLAASNLSAETSHSEINFKLANSAYDHPDSCYDREYLFQFSEIDPKIHTQAEAQAAKSCAQATGCMDVPTEPYHPNYFMVNGRSMPDDMDANYAPQYAHQPYNGDPHMHPGELVLLRIIGQGRWQHPFHEHGNHVRILGRDGNLILSSSADPNPANAGAQALAGPLLFTTSTTPGLAMDGIFYWTGKGLNWDVYGHGKMANGAMADNSVCIPDANGYYTSDPTAPNYFEWCADHNKALENAPFGQVATGGPVTLPEANILANGAWFGGSPYLGPDATARATGANGTTPPSGTIANSPSGEAGFAFMWHSHNEREITTNNIFPGGMMMMMLVDPRSYPIDESK